MSSPAKKSQKITINDEFILSQGQSIFKNSKTAQETIIERMKKDMDLYDGIFSENERKYSEFLGAERLFINKTYTNIHRIAIDVIESFLSDPEEIVAIRSYKSIPFESLEIVKSLINYRLNSHPIDIYKELYEATIDSIRNMYCVLKVFPRIKTEKVMIPSLQEVLLPDGRSIELPYEKEEVQIKAYEPVMECIPPEDVLFSKQATWKNYWKFPIVHKYQKSRDELKRLGYKNVDATPGGMDSTESDQLKQQRNQKYGSPFKQDNQVRDQDLIWVYEIWDFLPYKDEGLASCSYSLLGDLSGPTVVGKEWELNELPYKVSEFEYNRPPFVLGLAYPEPHRLPGKSYPQITEALQKETNAQRNQEREAIARDLRKTIYINSEANIDLASLLKRRIGGYVKGDLPANEAIQEIASSSAAAVLSQSQARTDQDYYETGLPPNLLGSSTNDGTATGETQQLANANKKIAFVLKNIAHTAFLPAFQMILRLEQTYCSDEFINLVTGRTLGWHVGNDNFPPREAIQGDFDLMVNTNMNKQAQVNKFLLLSDRMTQYNAGLAQLVQLGVIDPQMAQFANPMPLFDQLLRINGLKNVDEFKFQALPPAPTPGDVPGVASQTGNGTDTSQEVSQMNPAPPEVLSLAG